jgi:hypothetical protein
MAGVTDEQRKSWPTPNYDTPENHDGLIIGITVPLLALAIICKLLAHADHSPSSTSSIRL